MKRGRSNVYTEGLACTFHESDLRICLFEIDNYNSDTRDFVTNCYKELGLDVLIHRSGLGYHWISPTLVPLSTWKKFHSTLKGINPKCPMTTLRIKPNKYPHEDQIWYNAEAWYRNNPNNSTEICNLLNKWFGSYFFGQIITYPKIVRYPLPI